MSEIWEYTTSRKAAESIVVLSGELDMAVRDRLRDVVTAEVEHPDLQAVRVDLAAVSFLDSTIMSVLIAAYLTAQDLDKQFTIVGQNGLVQRALDTAGLTGLLAP